MFTSVFTFSFLLQNSKYQSVPDTALYEAKKKKREKPNTSPLKVIIICVSHSSMRFWVHLGFFCEGDKNEGILDGCASKGIPEVMGEEDEMEQHQT